jgi:hypothetical protein
MRIANSAWQNIIFRGNLSVHYPETLQAVLLLETLPIFRFKRAIPRLFAGMAHFCQPSARVNVFVSTLKVPVIAALLLITSNGLC